MNEQSYYALRDRVVADLQTIATRQYLALLKNSDDKEVNHFLGSLAWAVQHLESLPEYWMAALPPTISPKDCSHKNASITCTDCGINFHNAVLQHPKEKDFHEGYRQSFLKAVEYLIRSGKMGDGERTDLLDMYSHLWPSAPNDIRAQALDPTNEDIYKQISGLWCQCGKFLKTTEHVCGQTYTKSKSLELQLRDALAEIQMARNAEETADRNRAAAFAENTQLRAENTRLYTALQRVCDVDKMAPGRRDCDIWAEMLTEASSALRNPKT